MGGVPRKDRRDIGERMKGFILLAMIFCHILDDYCLQSHCLAKLKQRQFWKENAPQQKYRYDYIMALIMHGLSWTFCVMLPVWIYGFATGDFELFLPVYIANAIMHAAVDDLKANRFRINLIQDQLIHMEQLVVIWLMTVL